MARRARGSCSPDRTKIPMSRPRPGQVAKVPAHSDGSLPPRREARQPLPGQSHRAERHTGRACEGPRIHVRRYRAETAPARRHDLPRGYGRLRPPDREGLRGLGRGPAGGDEGVTAWRERTTRSRRIEGKAKGGGSYLTAWWHRAPSSVPTT